MSTAGGYVVWPVKSSSPAAQWSHLDPAVPPTPTSGEPSSFTGLLALVSPTGEFGNGGSVFSHNGDTSGISWMGPGTVIHTTNHRTFVSPKRPKVPLHPQTLNTRISVRHSHLRSPWLCLRFFLFLFFFLSFFVVFCFNTASISISL